MSLVLTVHGENIRSRARLQSMPYVLLFCIGLFFTAIPAVSLAAQPVTTVNYDFKEYVQGLADDVATQGNLANETAARTYLLEQQVTELAAQIEDLRLQNQALAQQLQGVRQADTGTTQATPVNVRTSSWWVAVLAVLWGLSL